MQPEPPMLASMFDDVRPSHIHARKHWPKEAKVDGVRIDLYLCPDGNHRAFSRVAGKHTGQLTEKTRQIAWLPELRVCVRTHLTGEAQAGKSSRSTMSILGSNRAEALRKQVENPLVFHAFDMPEFGGSRYVTRRAMLVNFIDELQHPNVTFSEELLGDPEDCLRDVMARGGHDGLMFKDPYGLYVPGTRPPDTWIKYKPRYLFQAVVLRALPGNGKFKGMLGALELGMVGKNGLIVPIGRCGSGHWTVANRQEMWRPRQVVEVMAYEITEEGKLWHPKFVRRREDIHWRDCSIQQLEDPQWMK